jgi:hypothetical protein
MADFLIKVIPLPKSRPSGLEEEYQPTTDAGMPLEASEKAVDAFSGVGSYPTTGQETNPLSGLLIESSAILVITAAVAAFYWRKEIWSYLLSFQLTHRIRNLIR